MLVGRAWVEQGFRKTKSVRDVAERYVNDVVELYTFRPAFDPAKKPASPAAVHSFQHHAIERPFMAMYSWPRKNSNPCLPERLRRSSATEGESKAPGNISFVHAASGSSLENNFRPQIARSRRSSFKIQKTLCRVGGAGL